MALTPPTRVVLFTDAPICGGAERSLAHLVAHLSATIEPTIMGTHRDTVAFVARGRSEAQQVVLPEIRSKQDVRRIITLYRALRASHPDVVHLNLTGPRSCRFALVAALLPPRLRVVAVEQLPIPPPTRWQRWWRRQAHQRLDAHVAVGHLAARDTMRHLGLEDDSILAIHNGVPDVGGHPRSRGDRRARITVGTVARFDDQKGLDLMLRALAPLDVDVRLVGDGPARPSLENLARELGLTDRLTLTGWTEDVAAELAQLDVFLLTSRAEGFPLAMLEAMLAGVTVIATDVGSVREAIIDGVTGVLVPGEDAAALQGAVVSLIADDDERARLGEAGRRHAATTFTATAMASHFERLYATVVAR